MNTTSHYSNPYFDNLIFRSLISRLQLRPPSFHAPPPHSTVQSLEDLLSDMLLNLSDSDSDSENESSSSLSAKTQLAREESRLKKEIVRTIRSGEIDKLKPNSGHAVVIGDHHICVGLHGETGSDYRVWEWQGHIMLFDEEDGFTPEYIYGSYFERDGAAKGEMKMTKEASSGDDDIKEKKEEKAGNVGLKELIDREECGSVRILHRNVNAYMVAKVQNCYRIKRDALPDLKSPTTGQKDSRPRQIQSIGYLGDSVAEASKSAAYKVAEAENKLFVAAEAVKEAERVAMMAEEMEALLQFAADCFDHCNTANSTLISERG